MSNSNITSNINKSECDDWILSQFSGINFIAPGATVTRGLYSDYAKQRSLQRILQEISDWNRNTLQWVLDNEAKSLAKELPDFEATCVHCLEEDLRQRGYNVVQPHARYIDLENEPERALAVH
jgi:hypothetical protein